MLLINSAVNTGSYGHLAAGAAIFLACAFFVITLADLEFLSFCGNALFQPRVAVADPFSARAWQPQATQLIRHLFGKQTGFQPGEVGR